MFGEIVVCCVVAVCVGTVGTLLHLLYEFGSGLAERFVLWLKR